MKTKIWILFGVLGLVALGAGAWLGTVGRESRDSGPLLALALPDGAGNQQALSQWQGKVVVINFWATWCTPCREEMPELVRIQQEFGARGLQVVGIAVDNPDKVSQFAKEIGLNYPSLIGGYSAVDVSKGLGNKLSALPFTIVLDRQGGVAQTNLGAIKPQQLRSKVSSLL
jgi:thiol-disulfide isomerase/thioredoxin